MAADNTDILNSVCFINPLRFLFFEPLQGTQADTYLQHAVYNRYQYKQYDAVMLQLTEYCDWCAN